MTYLWSREANEENNEGMNSTDQLRDEIGERKVQLEE